ncbi:centrosome and spindle pole-associated protein 1-like isoform X2 [Acipenser oxyrinchus oxyrinchus]|uniref:Centrosome and spindle pole-associated protein 1-like isoform X2 n=1 Tax=Acipenser oxyrinchus oxyrinchus TaxID=40147 RepID=A0AAD8GE42_ACIOX|nr:centrosome and spindle pole-associated protein 1-like isoform X2 [Acipenser oxyrinchus oxyrinchus]
MEDELEIFLEEQKAKFARDKANQEQDPPYMEIRTKANPVYNSRIKENIPPSKWPSTQKLHNNNVKEENSGLSLPLGYEYERKKHKLKQELRQDYRRYMAQKNETSTSGADPNTQGLSLPIGERRSAKERLRSERNKEYNQFLRGQEENALKREARSTIQYRWDRDEEPPVSSRVLPELYPEVQPMLRDRARTPPPRRDAATLTESQVLLKARRQEEGRAWRPEEERRPRLARLDYDSELDERKYHRDAEDAEALESHERRHPRLSEEPGFTEKRQRRGNHKSERDMPRLRDRRLDEYEDYQEIDYYTHRQKNENRPYRERKDRDAPLDYEDDYREMPTRRPLSAAGKPKPQMLTPSYRPNERSKSAANKEDGVFATGLMIGGADRDLAQQKRKEKYRQELQEQMAEQQRNKKREKELGLRVAASGAVDPEKQPDRIKQFGAITREYDNKPRDVPYRSGVGLGEFGSEPIRRPHEERPPPPVAEERRPPERPRVAFQAPPIDYTRALGILAAGDAAGMGGAGRSGGLPLNEEFHRELSSTLGEIVAPRITSVPPPLPPTLTDNYRTPYDDAYYYYGARNPLDPRLAYYGPGVMGVQSVPFVNPHAGPAQQNYPGTQSIGATGSNTTAGTNNNRVGMFPGEKPSQSKEAMQNYQEALNQQMQERREQKRKDKEERERYDAKIEAEMKNYDPWGKGGGGAPLKDHQGNLITDLNRMHKFNEDAYVNPETKALQEKRSLLSLNRNLETPRDETGAPSKHKVSGFAFSHSSPFARGTLFGDVPTPQQLHEQDKYKDYLRMQIEEKRRKELEERQMLRMEEEKEERRLAEQRTKIQQEYEEELQKKKRKEEEQKSKNEEQIRQAEERRKQEEQKEKEEKWNDEMRQQYERERQARLEELPRQPSPPIPTIQKKLASQTPRPPSMDSRHSVAFSDRPQSGAQSPPVPARRNQLRAAEDKKDVIGELSALRKQLRSEQRRLEGQLLKNMDRDELDTPLSGRRRDRSQVDIFDMARLRMQAPVRRPSSKEVDPINPQNIRDFNQLKYRETETREEVRQAYPDPPNDDHSLEIQQQALLREQQRRINSMRKRGDDHGFSIPRTNPHNLLLQRDHSEEIMRGSLLESESAFIGTNGETYPLLVDPEPRQLSARERRRQMKKIDFEIDDVHPREPQAQPDSYSLNSLTSLNVDQVRARNEHRMKRLEDLHYPSRNMGENISLEDPDDLLNLFSSKDKERPYSVETVATERWLRPGTSETLKRFMAGQMRRERPPSANSLALNWQGPSTSHG